MHGFFKFKLHAMQLAALFMLVAYSGVATGQESTSKFDLVRATELPPSHFAQILGSVGGNLKFEFQILDGDGSPLKNAELPLTWDEGKQTIQTDDQGIVSITFSPTNYKQLSIDLPSGTQCKLIHSPIQMMQSGGQIPPGAKIMSGTPAADKSSKGPPKPAIDLNAIYKSNLVGKPAPELAIEELTGAKEGSEAKLSSLKGKVVVLDFWATWCKPCVAGFEHLNELQSELGEDFVFISITDESPEEVAETLESHPLETWVAYDTDGSTFQDYGVKARPTAVVITQDGNIAAVTNPSLISADALRDLAAGKPWNSFPARNGASPGTPQPKDISPTDVSKPYKLSSSELLPPRMAQGIDRILEQISQVSNLEMDSIGLLLSFEDSEGQPARGLSIWLTENGQRKELTTNFLGRLTVPVTKANADSLQIEVPAGVRVIRPHGDAISVGGGVKQGNEKGNNKLLDGSNLSSMTDSSYSYEVLCAPEHRADSRRYLELLADIKSKTESLLSISLSRDYGIIIVDQDQPGSVAFKGSPRFPIQLKANLDKDVLANWVTVHEWVEGTLTTDYNLNYGRDSNLRFVGDGLAELAAYEYCLAKGLDLDSHLNRYRDRLQTLIEEGETEFDLLSQFPVARQMAEPDSKILAGYVISFLFWEQIKKETGEKTIKELVQRMKNNSELNSNDILTILKEISGRDYPTKINLEKALSYLESLQASDGDRSN
ncbi:MAG: TlpA disulfide reductase family protein [Pirellulaceae bacterium]